MLSPRRWIIGDVPCTRVRELTRLIHMNGLHHVHCHGAVDTPDLPSVSAESDTGVVGASGVSPVCSSPSAPTAEPDVEMDVHTVSSENLPWLCIVWDDPVNLMSYVTYVFQTVLGYSRKRANELMMQVHTEGKAVVSSGEKDKVEGDVKKLHVAGLWATMQQAG